MTAYSTTTARSTAVQSRNLRTFDPFHPRNAAALRTESHPIQSAGFERGAAPHVQESLRTVFRAYALLRFVSFVNVGTARLCANHEPRPSRRHYRRTHA